VTAAGYPVLLATLPGARPLDGPEPWQANLHSTCDCLAWRGALSNLERRHAEDRLGEATYSGFPLHVRPALVTAHALIERGTITERELEAKMREVRERFQRA
jgi:Nitrile hydratase beta subunit